MDNQNNNLKELSNLSGESSLRQTRYVVPILKFNGNKGNFTLLTFDKDKNFVPSEPTSETKGVILKVRRIYTGYQETPSGSIRWYSNEHNSNRDKLILFERREKGERSKLVAEGTLDEIRTKFPKIRLQQNLYFMTEDEKIVKLGVRGKSLGSFWDYAKEGFNKDEHIFQFQTKITCHQEENKGGLSFYVMDFVKGEESNIEVVGEKIREVASNLELQDKSFAENQNKNEDQNKGAQGGRSSMSGAGDESSMSGAENPQPSPSAAEKETKVEDIPY